MSEVKDPLEIIKDALNAPIEAVEPTQFDNAAIARFLAVRYSKPTLRDELAITEAQKTE